MTEIEIINKYSNVVANIEDRFAHSEVPMDVQMYYLIADLICHQNLKSFYKKYGAITIDLDFASAGKMEWLNLGELTSFEKEACILWNRLSKEINDQNLNRKNLPLYQRY